MGILLRQIEGPLWINNWNLEEFSPDLLRDFRTMQKEVSFFKLEDKDENVINRIAAALATNTSKINAFEYTFIEEIVIVEAGFDIVVSAGKTPDELVNTLHVNIMVPSGDSLLVLVKLLLKTQDNYDCITQNDLYAHINQNTSSGFIDIEKTKIETKDLRRIIKSLVNT